MATLTETIPCNKISWDALYKAKFAFDAPFEYHLADGNIFYSDSVIRLVPRRRLITFGIYQGKPAVAKIFFNPKRAKKHVNRELSGIKQLLANKVPTPEIYYHGLSEDKKSYVLIFRRLVNAIEPEVLWHQKENTAELLPLLKAIILELATQHVLGVLQRDLHLKNFLILGKKIFTIDTAEIDFHPYILSKTLSMQNLATFFSQLGVDAIPYYDLLFSYYAECRGWLLKPKDYHDLKFFIKKTYERRWERLCRKIFRESSHYAAIDEWRTFGIYSRLQGGEQFQAFLKDPEQIFSEENVHYLKRGNSSTVIKKRLDGKYYVIKRYNLKNVTTRFRRAFQTTRASHSWRLAQKLKLYDIPTAQPIAFLEKKCLGLNGRCYFITEWVEGIPLLEYLKQPDKAAQIDIVIERVASLLKSLIHAEITHGDLKATNVLIKEGGYPILIDLDGAQEHVSLASLRWLWQKEIRRFLKNFETSPKLFDAFKLALENDV